MMLLSQHRDSSSKTVRPRVPYGAQCMEHAIRRWSSVCLEAPHSQFGKGARPHLCIDKWGCPTPVRRQLSLTQDVWGKFDPTGLSLILGIKHGTWMYPRSTPRSIYKLSNEKRGCQVPQGCLKDSAQLAQTGV